MCRPRGRAGESIAIEWRSWLEHIAQSASCVNQGRRSGRADFSSQGINCGVDGIAQWSFDFRVKFSFDLLPAEDLPGPARQALQQRELPCGEQIGRASCREGV